jgi:hypothetical protein
VFDADLSDIVWIETDFVCDCAYDIPGFNSMHSTDFDTECLGARGLVRFSAITAAEGGAARAFGAVIRAGATIIVATREIPISVISSVSTLEQTFG